jgi:hypothetical protein
VQWSSVAWRSYQVTQQNLQFAWRGHISSQNLQLSSSAYKILISLMSQRFCCAELLFSHIRNRRLTFR